MKELLHGSVTLNVRGVDEFGRLLANVRLPDGRDLGQVLLAEQLAQPYEQGQRPNCADRAERSLGWPAQKKAHATP